jgi:amino-acid N-acetyltransferase
MNPDFVASLRSAAPYVHAHNQRVFVLAFGGETAELADFDKLIYDVALLQSLGVKLVLVHGSRPQIDRHLVQAGLTPRFENGLRVTDRAALECVKAAVGALRLEIEARLSTSLASTPMGGARVRVSGGNWVTAQPVGIRGGVDFQHTGEIRRVDADAIRRELDADRIALVSPVGYSPTGEIFNLRSEYVATAVATAIKADKLIFMTGSDPDKWKLADDTGDAGQLSLADGERLLSESRVDAADRGYLEAALAAARSGVRRVHLLGAQTEGALLRELYTRDGAGLMLYSDAGYDEAIRVATIDDVGGVLALIKPLEETGVLVPRSREQLELEIGQFYVMSRDNFVIACAALITFPDSRMGEFACVAVHAEYQNGGRAALLLARVETEARKLGLTSLFALTTHTPHWFVEHGFVAGAVEDLPGERQRFYNWRRNSLVLIKPL